MTIFQSTETCCREYLSLNYGTTFVSGGSQDNSRMSKEKLDEAMRNEKVSLGKL